MKKNLSIGIIIVVLVLGVGGFILFKKVNPDRTALPKVKIAMVTFPGYAPLYVAKEKGFFDGVDVELVRIESIGDIRAAMRSGDVNMYAATYDIYQSVKDVAPTGIGFLVVDESHGADGFATDANVSSINDLRGKKVGAEPGFPPYLVLQYLLDKEGMTLKDLDFQDMPTTDAGNAFAARKLAAAGIWEPTLSASVKARPGSKVFASSADIPGLVQDLLFADEKLAKEYPEALEKVAAGYFKALEYIDTNHVDAYQIMAKAFTVSVPEMEDFKTGVSWMSKEENKKLFDQNNSTNVYTTYDLVCRILQKNGDTNMCLKSHDKLTDAIIKNIK
ncbi:ABC transporter substrate-binding protein [Candidatus Uhrbacteria bacterium]|nr:ABC transporter substrate-binding protein [Candidatus Uhrbacteria bacterium]